MSLRVTWSARLSAPLLAFSLVLMSGLAGARDVPPQDDVPQDGMPSTETAVPAGTQDRLSWWLQLAAMMAAEPAPHPGLRLRIPVAGPAGVHDWDFEVIARDGDRWLLRRDWSRGAGQAALQWSAWLDGQRGFLPVELRFSLDDDEQWALRLLE